MSLENDSKLTIEIAGILKNSLHGAETQALFMSLRDLSNNLANIHFVHRWRQSNSCTNHLANLGLTKEQGCIIFAHPPTSLLMLLGLLCLGLSVVS